MSSLTLWLLLKIVFRVKCNSMSFSVNQIAGNKSCKMGDCCWRNATARSKGNLVLTVSFALLRSSCLEIYTWLFFWSHQTDQEQSPCFCEQCVHLKLGVLDLCCNGCCVEENDQTTLWGTKCFTVLVTTDKEENSRKRHVMFVSSGPPFLWLLPHLVHKAGLMCFF